MDKQIIAHKPPSSHPPLPPSRKQITNETQRYKSLSTVSPPKHILRFINPDPMLESSFSTHNMLQRFSPNKNQQQKQIRQEFGNQYFNVMGENIKESGNNLEDFVKRSHVVFRSRHLEHYKQLPCIKQLQEKSLLIKENEKKSEIYFNTPPSKFNDNEATLLNFQSAKVSPNVPRKKYVKPQPLNTTLIPELQFFDNFESSNLAFAIRSRDDLFQLILRNDYSTQSFTKWFYFKVKNVTEFDQKFHLNIINLSKSESFYGNGMKIAVNRCGIWNKEGKNVMYFKNQFIRNLSFQRENQYAKYYYTLSFQILIHAHEQIYIADNLPYTYSQLNYTLLKIAKPLNLIMKRQILCRTPLGNKVEILTFHKQKDKKNPQQLRQSKKEQNQNRYPISASSSKNIRSHILLRKSQAKSSRATLDPYNEPKCQKKNTIVILARSISCQTLASYIVQGILEQFANPFNENTYKLLQQYTIKIVPMVNPDGVIIGNSYCNLKGYNLYTNWNATGQEFEQHIPQLHKIRENIISENDKICMLIDLHQHNEKYGVNIYGCKGKKPTKNKIQKEVSKRQFLKIFGQIIGQKNIFMKTHFSNMQQNLSTKEGTARVLFWRSLQTQNVYQFKICNCSSGQNQYHYDQSAYKILGKQLLQALSIFFVSQRKAQKQNILKQKEKQQKSFCSMESLVEFDEESKIIDEVLVRKEPSVDIQRQRQNTAQKKQTYHRPLIPRRKSASKSKSPKKNKTYNVNNDKTVSENNPTSMKTQSDNPDIVQPTRLNLKSSRSIKSIPSKIQKATAMMEKGIIFKTNHNRQKSKSNGGQMPAIIERKQLMAICEVSGQLKDSKIKISSQLKNQKNQNEVDPNKKIQELMKDFQIIQNGSLQRKEQKKIPPNRHSLPLNGGEKTEKIQLTFLQRIGLQNSKLNNPYKLSKVQTNTLKKKEGESQIKYSEKTE